MFGHFSETYHASRIMLRFRQLRGNQLKCRVQRDRDGDKNQHIRPKGMSLGLAGAMEFECFRAVGFHAVFSIKNKKCLESFQQSMLNVKRWKFRSQYSVFAFLSPFAPPSFHQ